MEKSKHELIDKMEYLFGTCCGIANGKKNNYFNVIITCTYINTLTAMAKSHVSLRTQREYFYYSKKIMAK